MGPAIQASKPRAPYLLIVSGKSPGMGYKIQSTPITIGRTDADIIPDPNDQGISRLHACVQIENDELYIVDKNSTNGTLANGQRVDKKPLKNGDLLGIGGTTIKFVDRGDGVQKITSRRSYDQLTGVYNKARFKQILTEAVAEVSLFDISLGLLMVDVDQFAKANLAHGEKFGDLFLKELVELLSSLLLDDQEIYRVGGEEFAVLLRGPSARFAMDVGELIRQAVEVFNFNYEGKTANFTVSIGVTLLEAGGSAYTDPEDIFDNVLASLRAAKMRGGNAVCSESS